MYCLQKINKKISLKEIINKCHLKNKPFHLIDIDNIIKTDISNLPLKLNHGSEKHIEYKSSDKNTHIDYHWGQRKLLLTEIQFITNYYHLFNNNKKKYILYIGAAGGRHITILSKLFPDINFILYDPVKFEIKESNTIKIHNVFFTHSDAKYYSENLSNFMFISDIRNTNVSLYKQYYHLSKHENIIYDDMILQMEWHNIINPIKSLLKFRLSYNKNYTTYLHGDIYIQPWTSYNSTETRLIPNNDIKKYDNKLYEGEMYYFNMITRKKCYQNISYNSKYYCCCYDCSLELLIIFNYIKNILKQKATYSKAEKIGRYFTKKLSLGKYNSLLDMNIKTV